MGSGDRECCGDVIGRRLAGWEVQLPVRSTLRVWENQSRDRGSSSLWLDAQRRIRPGAPTLGDDRGRAVGRTLIQDGVIAAGRCDSRAESLEVNKAPVQPGADKAGCAVLREAVLSVTPGSRTNHTATAISPGCGRAA